MKTKAERLAEYTEAAAEFRAMLRNYPDGRGYTVTWWGKRPMPEQEFWSKSLAMCERRIAKLK